MADRRKRKKSPSTKGAHKHLGLMRAPLVSKDFVDRDIAWLNFNRRVLEQAQDERVPLLERVRFLTIFHSNLDEFFMKRISFYREVDNLTNQPLTLSRIDTVRSTVQGLLKDASQTFRKSIRPALESEGIYLLDWKDLTEKEKKTANDLFNDKIFPVLTPLSVDPGHPFPHISNLSTSLAVSLRYPGRDELFFSRLKIPPIFPAYVCLTNLEDNETMRWVSLMDIILQNLPRLFTGMEIISTMPFRITRNIELERDEEEAEDLLEMVSKELKERRFGEVVKVEVPPQPDAWLLNFLMAELEIQDNDIYTMEDQIDYKHLEPIWSLKIPELKYKPWNPVVPNYFEEDAINMFDLLSQRDILLHHPYESFTASVEKFIHNASEDPNVLAIKMTLYRTSQESSFLRSLIRAAESGKQVVCVIELKARFDEERNIAWAQRLEDAGVHVVYGVVGFKTHCKTALVVRMEPQGIRCYSHIGTGNYHAQTAKAYTDVGLMTSDPSITNEIVELFHHLTGRSMKWDYKKLLVAPFNMKTKLLEMIERETKNAKAGKPAEIIIKCNNLEDHDICRAMYEASMAGVQIQLIVRSICTLKPGVPGLSENIRVFSVVDRFLEHSRIFFFRNAGAQRTEGEVFIGSADLMYRNLLGRLEVIVPVEKPELKEKCLKILEIMISDRCQSWEMQSDGNYIRRTPTGKDDLLSGQEQLMLLTKNQFKPK